MPATCIKRNRILREDRNMRKMLTLITLGMLLGTGCATQKGESVASPNFNPTAITRIAVVDVTGQVYGEPAKNQIADFFSMELTRKGYSVIARSSALEKLQEEQALQTSGITTDAEAAQAGRILNVPAVLLVNIPEYGAKMNMTAKIVNVEDGSILWIGSGSAKTGKTESTFLGAAAGAVAGAILGGGDSKDRTIGGVAGAVLGGAAGYALSPEESETMQKLIKEKICAGLPSRI